MKVEWTFCAVLWVLHSMQLASALIHCRFLLPPNIAFSLCFSLMLIPFVQEFVTGTCVCVSECVCECVIIVIGLVITHTHTHTHTHTQHTHTHTHLRRRTCSTGPDVAPAPETAGPMPKAPSGAPNHHHYTDRYYRGRVTAASRAINSGFIPRAPTYTV